jgi:polyisoprenoid-binding protein YceI
MSTSTLQTQIPAGTYTVDASHSHVGFVARHAMVTKVRGSFNEFSANASFDPADPSASRAEVTIDVASIDTRSEQRDGHLRSGDFFDVETYPTLSFVSTQVELADESTLRVTGDLTIKDVTKPVTIDFEYTGTARDPFGNDRVGFEGSVVVNRKDWDLTWNAALETGGVLVSDKVTLELELSAIKAA